MLTGPDSEKVVANFVSALLSLAIQRCNNKDARTRVIVRRGSDSFATLPGALLFLLERDTLWVHPSKTLAIVLAAAPCVSYSSTVSVPARRFSCAIAASMRFSLAELLVTTSALF